MSDFVKHEACPYCGSRDNLGVYDDGHKYCFGCGHYEKGNGLISFKKLEKENDRNISLPSDCSSSIPINPVREWLSQYYITDQDILVNKFQWSEDRQLLVMPVYDIYGKLLMWCGRRFNISDRQGRYYIQGKTEGSYPIYGNINPGTVVIVEDMISAIRVGKVATSHPLFGSNVSSNKIVELSKKFDNLIVWLDYDKAGYAIKLSQTYGLFFRNIQTIVTIKDPKAYTENEIKERIYGSS